MNIPSVHLSVRVPWHDNGWNGKICCSPKENGSCMFLPRIAEAKDADLEENLSDQWLHELQESQLPPHSPFIISDNHKENVYKFVRDGKTLKLENPKHKTYGTSITFLMKQIFDRDITISDYANNELKELKKEIRNIS